MRSAPDVPPLSAAVQDALVATLRGRWLFSPIPSTRTRSPSIPRLNAKAESKYFISAAIEK